MKKGKHYWWYGTAAALCVAVALIWIGNTTSEKEHTKQDSATKQETTYEEIYQNFSKIWREQAVGYSDIARGATQKDIALLSETGDAKATGDHDYGKTNQQEENVEEADIIKNDGRYLYRIVQKESQYEIQIVDTQGGLTKKSGIGTFDDVSEFYVSGNQLILMETGWAENETKKEESGLKKIFGTGEYFSGRAFCKVHIYDITDRQKPSKIKTFTVAGNYLNSRISDGYLYFFTQDNVYKPGSKKDYDEYIPLINGKPMSADKIYLPADNTATSYLVMASVNLDKPDKFADTGAIVCSGERFYASEKNIYIADMVYQEYTQEGEDTNKTKLYRVSYRKGKLKKEAEGTVKGILRDDMAWSEYDGYLRLVTTVDSYRTDKVTDDITGEELGYATSDRARTNSLYVLDKNLKIVGKLENLAKGEQIKSARFLGTSGYFVTFRQVDPLFSVDISNPKEPKLLDELKVSGFSEYLHFYGENRLLGIGLEADSESGRTEGLKLSMFDISDAAKIKEETKLPLEQYDYAEALYNYKAVLIDAEKNIFGFLAEGYGEKSSCEYLLFTYENGQFYEKLKIDCSDIPNYQNRARGTYIGDSFYLLCADGTIEEYSLQTAQKLAELEE